MKIIALLMVVVLAIGAYVYITQEQAPSVELNDVSELEQEQNIQTESLPSALTNSIVTASELMTEVQHSGGERLHTEAQSLDIQGEYDPDALAPEDESVQNFDDDAMIVSESDGIAPEAGTEMMPDGDAIPMISEPIVKSQAPKPADGDKP